MKTTTDIDPHLIENANEFDNEFFRRFTLRHAPNPLQINGDIQKDYLFPTLYGDVTCAQAIFMCSYEKARRMMLHPKIHPVRMPLGRSLVAFSCYEYKKVLGVAPYNEIAMTIPVIVDPKVNVPVLPMVMGDVFKPLGFGFYVFSMPVTSAENQIRGEKIWGLPKIVQEIDIFEESGDCVTIGKETDGTPYFTLRVPMDGTPTEFDVSSNLYTRRGDTLLRSETNFKATFNVIKHMELLVRKDQPTNRPYLEFGDTESAQVLQELEIEDHPFQFRFARHMSSCFDLPDPNYRQPFEFSNNGSSQRHFAKKIFDVAANRLNKQKRKPWAGHPKIVVLGTGVVGGTVAGWLAPHYDNLYCLDQGPVAEALKKTGITLYPEGHRERSETVPVKVVQSLEEVADADVVVIAVKNYSLDNVAKAIQAKLGDRPLIVAMQNGLANQEILPKYFTKIVYCIVSYNAWMDEPAVIGFQKRGPLVLGTKTNELKEEMDLLADIFSAGVPTVVTDHLDDAAHSKLVINLTNSLTTLLGHRDREITRRDLFQQLLANLIWEGVEVVKAAGYKECKLGGMPSWKILWAGAKLPQQITSPLFERNVKKMVISSMAQDILQRGNSDNELETINGYIIRLADQVNHPAPYNRAIYKICQREFSAPDFEPLDINDVWNEIRPSL